MSALPCDAMQFSDTFSRYGGVEGYAQALEVGATHLPLDRWVQVRTPAFKAEYGDWETLIHQEKIDSFIERAIASHDPRETLEFRQVSQHEIHQIRKELGVDVTGFVHEFVAHEFKHAFNQHNRDSFHEKNQRSLTLMDLKRIPVVLDGYDSLRIKPAGQNRSSLIYSKAFPGGRIEYVERVLETSSRQKPRLSTKTVWVKSPAGVTSSPPQVYTPERSEEILPFTKGRINPADIAATLNPATGEPTLNFLTHSVPSPLIDLNGLGNREAVRKLHDSVGGDIAHLPLLMLSAQAAGKQIDAQALIKAADLHPIARKDVWLASVRSLPAQTNTRSRNQDKDISR